MKLVLKKAQITERQVRLWPLRIHNNISSPFKLQIFSSPPFPFSQTPPSVTLYHSFFIGVFFRSEILFIFRQHLPISLANAPPSPPLHLTTCGLAFPPVKSPSKHSHPPLRYFTIPAIALVSYDHAVRHEAYSTTPQARNHTHTFDQHTLSMLINSGHAQTRHVNIKALDRDECTLAQKHTYSHTHSGFPHHSWKRYCIRLLKYLFIVMTKFCSKAMYVSLWYRLMVSLYIVLYITDTYSKCL